MLYPVLLEPIKRREEFNLKDINMSIKEDTNLKFGERIDKLYRLNKGAIYE